MIPKLKLQQISTALYSKIIALVLKQAQFLIQQITNNLLFQTHKAHVLKPDLVEFYFSKLLNIQTVFSCTCNRWVNKSRLT
jgi:hypothetical protein